MTDGKLRGKTALVTGAGSGIGEAIAVLFAAQGAGVAVVDYDAAGGRRTAQRIVDGGGTAAFIQADVSQAADAERMVTETLERLGALDILCNNAGIGVAAVCHETSEADWDRTMAVDLKGVFLGCKYAIPHMLERGGGVICNTSSVAGQVGVLNRAAYCAAKAGVLGLTKSIAIDYAERGIRCNALLPGTVDSPWIGKILAQQADPQAQRTLMEGRQPIGRMGRPEEIAGAALFLCSDGGAYVTGTGLVIDGGLTAR
ncbi:MAG: SDR family oxidoreductase [Chloroflexota bacterium]|nr:SDR family oxidoreductase [Chloroflexota bacterium]